MELIAIASKCGENEARLQHAAVKRLKTVSAKNSIVTPYLTFDQPLWIKAVDSYQAESLDIFSGLADSIH